MALNFLPKGPKLYSEETICDQPLDNLLSDLVREQVLKNTREEVPHSVAVKIEKREEMKRKNGKVFTAILATCLLYTSPSPRDPKTSRMPSSA